MKSASKVQIFLYISIIFRNFAAESCKDGERETVNRHI